MILNTFLARITSYDQCIQRSRSHPFPIRLHRQRISALHENRRCFKRADNFQGLAALILFPVKQTIPVRTFREPDLLYNRLVFALSGFRNRSSQNQITEIEFTGMFVSFFCFRMFNVKSPVQRQHVVIALSDRRINVRHQTGTQMINLPHGRFFAFSPQPWPPVALLTYDGMYTKRRVQQAELSPACIKFRIKPVIEPADIVSPEEASGISARRGQINFKTQHFPVSHGITGELNRMTVVTPSSPTAESGSAEHPLFCPVVRQRTHRITIIDFIQPGKMLRACTTYQRISIVLLPVQPPESNSH